MPALKGRPKFRGRYATNFIIVTESVQWAVHSTSRTSILHDNSWKLPCFALAIFFKRFFDESVKFTGFGIIFDLLISKLGFVFCQPFGCLAHLDRIQFGNFHFYLFNATHSKRI
jgi:hypothetical protein